MGNAGGAARHSKNPGPGRGRRKGRGFPGTGLVGGGALLPAGTHRQEGGRGVGRPRRPAGRVARGPPCGLPACLRPCPGGLLCADALDGCVTRVAAALTDAQCVYRGDSPLDAMVL